MRRRHIRPRSPPVWTRLHGYIYITLNPQRRLCHLQTTPHQLAIFINTVPCIQITDHTTNHSRWATTTTTTLTSTPIARRRVPARVGPIATAVRAPAWRRRRAAARCSVRERTNARLLPVATERCGHLITGRLDARSFGTGLYVRMGLERCLKTPQILNMCVLNTPAIQPTTCCCPHCIYTLRMQLLHTEASLVHVSKSNSPAMEA